MATRVLIYGLQPYTDSWARIKRAHKGFEHLPAAHTSSLDADLAKYPKVKLVAVACWAELICSKVNGLHVAETLSPLVSEVYDQVSGLSRELGIKVIYFLQIFQ